MNRKGYKHLDLEQRKKLQTRLQEGIGAKEIAAEIGVSLSTVYNEIRRGSREGEYRAEIGQSLYEKGLSQKGPTPILQKNETLQRFIRDQILREGKTISRIVEELSQRRDPELGYASYGTIFGAIKRGDIPGVTEEIYRNNLATVQKDKSLYIPKWFLEKYGIKEGQQYEISLEEDKIILKKLKES